MAWNVRELQNVIERSLIIGETTEFSIDKSWVANEPQAPGSAPTDQKQMSGSVSKQRLRKVTERSLERAAPRPSLACHPQLSNRKFAL